MSEPAEAPMIVWDTSVVLDDPPSLGATSLVRLPEGLQDEPSTLARLADRLAAWGRALRTTRRRIAFDRQHCTGRIETTRRASSSVAHATSALGRADSIAWSCPISTGQLLLGPFTSVPDEPGEPWIAAAVLHEARRRLAVSVVVFTHDRQHCGIEIRPRYRRPWSPLRVARCFRSTHFAADRLRDIVQVTDLRWHALGEERNVPLHA